MQKFSFLPFLKLCAQIQPKETSHLNSMQAMSHIVNQVALRILMDHSQPSNILFSFDCEPFNNCQSTHQTVNLVQFRNIFFRFQMHSILTCMQQFLLQLPSFQVSAIVLNKY